MEKRVASNENGGGAIDGLISKRDENGISSERPNLVRSRRHQRIVKADSK